MVTTGADALAGDEIRNCDWLQLRGIQSRNDVRGHHDDEFVFRSCLLLLFECVSCSRQQMKQWDTLDTQLIASRQLASDCDLSAVLRGNDALVFAIVDDWNSGEYFRSE